MPYLDENKKLAALHRHRERKSGIEIPSAKHKSLKSKCKNDLLRFIDSFLKADGIFDLPFSPAHIEVVKTLQKTILNGGQFSLAMPRGTGKSSITKAALLWAILYGHRNFIISVRATIADAQNTLQDVRTLFECEETRLFEAFPEVCVPIARLEGSNRKAISQNINGVRTKMHITRNKIIFPTVKGSAASGAILLARGIESSLRGINIDKRRPDLVLIDDIETSESAFCQSSIERIGRVLDRDIAGLPGPGKSIAAFFLCTVQNRGGIGDVYTDKAKKPAWNGKRYSALIQPPDRLDLWVEYQEKRKNSPDEANSFYAQNKAEMDAGSKVLWEHRYDPTKETSALQAIYNYKTDYGEASFLTELQNKPPEETEILDDHLSTKDVTKRIINIEKGVIPNGFQKLVVGVDVGKHLIHYVITAFDRHNSGHVVDYGVRDVAILGGDVGYSIKKALTIFRDEVVNPGFKDEAGNTKNVDLVLIDSGYMPEPIYAFCRENGFRKFRPCKGHSQYGAEKGGVKLSRYFVPKDTSKGVAVGNNFYFGQVAPGTLLAHLNVDFFKESLIDRWKNDNQHGGMTIYNGVWTDHIRFAGHMTAERLQDDFKPGRAMTRKWTKHSRANHFLDSLVLCLAGASMLGGPAAFEGDGQDAEKTPQNTPSESESGRMQHQSGNAKIGKSGKYRVNYINKIPAGYQPLPY